MKPTITTKLVVTAALSLGISMASQAALTVVNAYENPGTDGDPFLYNAKGTFSDASYTTWNVSTSVGGWSYANTATSVNKGWGHTASWYLIEIQQATTFTISMASLTADARPGFVIYAGESVEDDPGAAHSFSNNGVDMSLNDGWDNNGPGGTRGLTYVSHGVNNAANSLQGSVFLNPGLYTIAIGNSASANLTPGAPTYDVTFAVPEPSALGLTLLGGLLAFRRRR
ncbi:MAG: PEP-CTERM sorting domain-containing protein [Verrucomicrobiaceae bacterium]|nr:MAG: PEP-CTERM sorting domain-containing protein [Verrucomicrobiaceae bacterium]